MINYKMTDIGDLQVQDNSFTPITSEKESTAQNVAMLCRLQKGSSFFDSTRGIDLLGIRGGLYSLKEISARIQNEISKITNAISINIEKERDELKVNIIL